MSEFVFNPTRRNEKKETNFITLLNETSQSVSTTKAKLGHFNPHTSQSLHELVVAFVNGVLARPTLLLPESKTE